jgi:polar amino acid transport system substrate-binding protein
MAKANPSVSPSTRPGRLLGGVWTAASVVLIAMFTAAVTSHLTARELSGLVRDAADLHHVRVGTVRDAVAVGYLDREGIRHQDFATVEEGLRAVAASQLDAVVYDKPILAWLVRQDHPNELQMLDLSLIRKATRSLFRSAARCRGAHRAGGDDALFLVARAN